MAYHVLVNGEQRGPFETTAVAEMIDRGEVTADTLVWTADMSDWSAAGTVDGLSQLFGSCGTTAATEARPTPLSEGLPRLAIGQALGGGLRVITQQPLHLIGVIVLYAVLGLVAAIYEQARDR